MAMSNNTSKGIDKRKSFDTAAKVLSYFMPIFDSFHLVIRDIIDDLNVKDWKNLFKKKNKNVSEYRDISYFSK